VTAAALGAPVSQPLARVREYVDILRTGLREGKVHHEGRSNTVDADLPAAPATPVIMAALGPKAFEAAERSRTRRCHGTARRLLDEVARPALARAPHRLVGIPPIVGRLP